jgi:hypothetical protein
MYDNSSQKINYKRLYHIIVCKFEFESKNNIQYIVKKINDELSNNINVI